MTAQTQPTPVVEVDPLAGLGKGGALVVFGAGYSAPYLLLAETFETLKREGVNVVLVDVENWAVHAESFRIVSLPTFVWMLDGAERRRLIGAVSLKDLRRFTSRK